MRGSAATAGITPEQFLRYLERNGPPPVCLFLGAEAYQRQKCRRALIHTVLNPEERTEGLIRHDLEETNLTEVLDDARALSLFAPRRVIWVSGAEAALPRSRAAAESSDEDGEEKGSGAALSGYVHDPTPGTVLVLESSRWEFEGEDKARLERVQKFYAAVPVQVEFRPYSLEASRAVAREIAREKALNIGVAEIGLLVEVLGGDASRIAAEIEKLSLYAGERKVTEEDIVSLVLNARASTVFALVAALGRGDRARSLDILDTLVRDGEYLPLALTFLATQFRLALIAREAGLRTPQQILAHFSKLGVRVWPDRAQQVQQTVAAFPQEKLETALKKISTADRALREPRPDDRVVLEELIFGLT